MNFYLNHFTLTNIIVDLSVIFTYFSFLIGHFPDSILFIPERRIDLGLAGHTHGGQVQIPGIGPIITLSNVPRPIAAGGLHNYDGTNIIVSRGLGGEGRIAPRIRFGAEPHLVLIELIPKSGEKP